MHAGLDSLITLLIFVGIAIISSILKKRQGGGDEEQAPPMPRRMPRETQERARTWEEELRDLLQNQEAEPAPPSSIPPLRRDYPRPTQSAPTPPPLPEEESIAVELPAPQPRVEPHFQALPGLTEAAPHYSEAAMLHERVAEHMREVTHHRVAATTVQRRGSMATQAARDLLKNPASIRQAILATVILGPPRALDREFYGKQLRFLLWITSCYCIATA